MYIKQEFINVLKLNPFTKINVKKIVENCFKTYWTNWGKISTNWGKIESFETGME